MDPDRDSLNMNRHVYALVVFFASAALAPHHGCTAFSSRQFLISTRTNSRRLVVLHESSSSAVAERPSVAAAQRAPPQPRVIRSVSPFGLSPTDAEYLTGAALQMGKFNSALSLALTTVDKLNPSASLLTKLGNAALMSTRVPRIMAMVYVSPARVDDVEVTEGVRTVTKDAASGKPRIRREKLLGAIVERAAFLVLEDLKNIRDGIYPLPSELRLATPESNPVNAIHKTLRQVLDGLKFAFQDGTYQGQVDYSDPRKNLLSPELQRLAAGLDLPDYYLTDYHSVPGGFLSPEHPPVYDLVSETVFFGTHFMARRMVLRPLAEAMKKLGRPKGQGLKLLDLGTGNGSFLIQLREAFPELDLCGLDLSPAMLEFAENSFQTHPSMKQNSGKTPKLIRASMTNIFSSANTATGIQKESFEFVTQTNCFHEMPAFAISDTAKEILQVLKPGGIFVHLDAVQMRDDPSIASVSRTTFDKNFNEPYMRDWMENVDLDAIFAARGLVPVGPSRPYYQSTVRCYRKEGGGDE